MEIYQETSAAAHNSSSNFRSKKLLDGSSAVKTAKKGLGGAGAGAGPNTQRRRALGDISNNNQHSTGRAGKGGLAGGGLKRQQQPQKPPRFNLNLKKGGLVVHEEDPLESRKPLASKPRAKQPFQALAEVQTKTASRQQAPAVFDDFEFDTCSRRNLSPSPEFDGGFDVDAVLAAGSRRAGRRRKPFAVAETGIKARHIADDLDMDDLLGGLSSSASLDRAATTASVGEPDAATSLDLSDLCEDLEF
ncbi:Hypothetical Protein FCC1311_087402 [Hondaea fermentalgiana]|uniref:Uncharacterized protein n=1 Tax=Hondaea fermentalgiana TaxID=2315210 RepID=A0A2R5GNP5_9STRA|nr:Hypothetical Protein FCC1311_087402 [Hondaea fermentalgiana]|eukprot:GBG32516.1 Hypothetical Protein FCC1311_087402 [Hondaea fermentalgiana]